MSRLQELKIINRLRTFLSSVVGIAPSQPVMAEFQPRFASENEFGVSNQDVTRQLAPTYKLLAGLFDRHPHTPIEFRRDSSLGVRYRLDNGHRVIQLDTRGTSYQQYTYQFAHELSHILTNFHLSDRVQRFKWFEETLAELASFYVLSEFAKKPPSICGYTAHQWQVYLKSIYDKLEQDLRTTRGLSIDAPIAPWFSRNESLLKENSTMRDINWWMAWHMYPYFNQNPAIFWQACGVLNKWLFRTDSNFEQYLNSWESVLNQRGMDTRPVTVFRILYFST